ERLRAAWHAAGTTGYEVMDDMGGALVEPGGLERLAAAGRAEGEPDVATCAAEGRRLVATTAFAGALGRVASGLRVEAPAVVEAAIALPVYRTYLDGGEPDPDDVAAIAAATGGSDEVRGALEDPLRVQAVIAWQQTTGAVMAKGVEDTAWYRLPGRLAFCEVGGAPGSPREVGARRLHERAAARAADGRAGLVPSTTHDTKRSGDARARLYALTELAEPFEDGLRRYRELLLDASGPTGIPAVLERAVAGESRLLAQMILAVLPAGPWPDRTATTEREPDGAQLPERVALALAKSAREAKLRTSWNAPDLAYEAALARLAEISLRDGARVVHDAFSGLVGDVARLGATLSLSSVVLRSALPGVPDCYQGDEVWNLSLVDPDNRRYVAFDALARRLEALELTSDHRPTPGLARECRSRWRDGDVKLLVTASCLAAHRFAPGALAPSARYLRVGAVGPAARNVLAFGRLSPGAIALAITTRCPGVLDCADDDLPAGARSYGETRIELPGELRGRLADVCTGREVDATSGRLEVSAVLADLPVALLVGA
ncbi:MAG TPA: hypothetical protein VND23_04935, partial [Acidimicrobiales bacterium]|nr:hypothetical protein [Acidimicrobiales bacterium]